MSGSASYSAQIATCSGPEPARGDERGGEVADATLDAEARGVEHVRQPARGALLLEGELGSRVDAAAEGEQVRLGGSQTLPGAVLRIHRLRFAYRDRPRQAGLV